MLVDIIYFYKNNIWRKKQQKTVESFYSVVSLFSVGLNRRQLGSHFCLLNKSLVPEKVSPLESVC